NLSSYFPLIRQPNAPLSFEEVLGLDGIAASVADPTITPELRHRSTTKSSREVERDIAFMKANITPALRPQEHISFFPNWAALRSRRKEFVSFVQRLDLTIFAERLEQRSKGALHGWYGKNFKPYQQRFLVLLDNRLQKGADETLTLGWLMK